MSDENRQLLREIIESAGMGLLSLEVEELVDGIDLAGFSRTVEGAQR